MTGTDLVLAVMVLVVVALTIGVYVGSVRFRRRHTWLSPTQRGLHLPRKRARRIALVAVLVAGLLSASVLELVAPHSAAVLLQVRMDSSQARLHLSQHQRQPCPPARDGPVCVVSFRVPTGSDVPIEVVPDDALSPGVTVLYYGCEEGDGVPSCTVHADTGHIACASTTSSRDEEARRACQQVSRIGSPTAQPSRGG